MRWRVCYWKVPETRLYSGLQNSILQPIVENTKKIYLPIIEGLQRQKFAWLPGPYIEATVQEELITDQFLTGLDNHELCVHVATIGAQSSHDFLWIARSLEAVTEKTSRSQARNATTHTWFITEEKLWLRGAGWLVEQVFVRLQKLMII